MKAKMATVSGGCPAARDSILRSAPPYQPPLYGVSKCRFNTEDSISKHSNLKIFLWGGMPPDPLSIGMPCMLVYEAH